MIRMIETECLICKKMFKPEAISPVQPMMVEGKLKFFYMHKECYNKRKNQK